MFKNWYDEEIIILYFSLGRLALVCKIHPYCSGLVMAVQILFVLFMVIQNLTGVVSVISVKHYRSLKYFRIISR